MQPLVKIFQALCVFITFIGQAAQSEIFVIPLSGQDEHVYTTPYSGVFTALDGKVFDLSHYYVSSHPEFNMNGLAFWTVSETLTFKVPWFLDAGYSSRLYEVDPVVKLGIFAIINSDKTSIEVGVTNLVVIGGKVNETSCIDELWREFHCGSGLPWVIKPVIPSNDILSFSIKWAFKF